MNILIAAEKPSISKCLAPHAQAHWPGANITFLNVIPYANILHSYPRGLKHSDFPFVGPNRDKLRAWADWSCLAFSFPAEGEPSKVPPTKKLLKEADLIVFACDPDATGAVAFSVLIEQVFEDDRANSCPALWLSALDDESIRKAFCQLRPFGEVAADALAAGRTKRYFDWNWNTNSLSVLSAAMRDVGVASDAPPLSKYALQLLYGLRSRDPMTEGEVAHLMSKWEGTGKYAPVPGAWHPHLGGPASYCAIMENLLEAKLIEKLPKGARRYELLKVSTLGLRLLDALHPDCEDPDLPFRLDAWCQQGAAAYPAIDRYIRTFFGKQLRFGAKGAV